STYDIPIPCLCLDESFSKVDGGVVILNSGLKLNAFSSIEEIEIFTELGREFTEADLIGLLVYGSQSHRLKTMRFYCCLLPSSIPPESIPSTLKAEVSWRLYRLDLRSGRWLHNRDGREVTDEENRHEVDMFQTKYRESP
ncbi:hypothetical protein, partial [Salmonella sp. s51884]|uniref:hypothetical protein n=1 Tax=Salmonella sp. s51884 TaxID=3159654 RepID=UPI003980811D